MPIILGHFSLFVCEYEIVLGCPVWEPYLGVKKIGDRLYETHISSYGLRCMKY